MGELRRYFGRYIWFYALVVAAFTVGALFTTEAAEAMGQLSEDRERTTVILDPGHGGEDGGAVSCTGVHESRFNLEIGLRLNDLLHLLGHQTVMTRREDVAVHSGGDTVVARKASDLKNRVKLVNSTANSLLLSIHQNQFSDGRYSGAQVFYSPGAASKALAEQTQARLIANTDPDSRRQAKPSKGVYLMEHIACPGILVECGFLSNPREEALLRTAEYQKKLSCILCGALSQYMLP